MDKDWLKNAVLKIHYEATIPAKIVMAMAGNGTDAVSELVRHGGASNTLLAQHLLYSEKATVNYLGSRPDKLVSGWCARQLAMAAYQEALKLKGDDLYPVVGIGTTASLLKPISPRDPQGERQGRVHEAFIAIQSQGSTFCISMQLQPSRTREEEEELLGLAILEWVALSRGFALDRQVKASLNEWEQGKYEEQSFKCDFDLKWEAIKDVIHRRMYYAVWEKGKLQNYLPALPVVVLAGSFNPLHDGHRKMAEVAGEFTQLKVMYDLGITNSDKPPLDYMEIAKRLEPLKDQSVLISDLPFFVQKSAVYPEGTVFAMGVDTFNRIGSDKYGVLGDQEESAKQFEKKKNRFLVFPRKVDGVIHYAKDNLLRARLLAAGLLDEIAVEKLCMEISSTAIRKTLNQ